MDIIKYVSPINNVYYHYCELFGTIINLKILMAYYFPIKKIFILLIYKVLNLNYFYCDYHFYDLIFEENQFVIFFIFYHSLINNVNDLYFA